MRIAASTRQATASHQLTHERARRETRTVWRDPIPQPAARPDVSRGRPAAELPPPHRPRPPAPTPTALDADPGATDPQLRLLRDLLYWLFGVEPTAPPRCERADAPPAIASLEPARPPARQGWGMDLRTEATATERETLTWTTAGTIRTTDGATRAFSLTLTMDRAFTQTTQTHQTAGDALRDPLVLNFAGTGAALTATPFVFDLTGDGVAEVLPSLAAGSGFLAIDQAGDGAIMTGAELFGPRTGDGFAELAEHDADGNGWIDAADPLYRALRVWRPAPDGPGTLTDLPTADVGAIAVTPTPTPFTLTDAQHRRLGQVGQTSVFLTEAGQAGTIQHVEFVV